MCCASWHLYGTESVNNFMNRHWICIENLKSFVTYTASGHVLISLKQELGQRK